MMENPFTVLPTPKKRVRLVLSAWKLMLWLGFVAAMQVNAATGGRVVAWGYNASGQTNVPPGLSGVVAVSAGWQHSVALKSDGTVVAWGTNEFGQLNIPPGLSGVTAIASGHSHILALKADGTVVSWGQVTNVPVGLTGVKAIAAGGGQVSMALQTNGTVVLWSVASNGSVVLLGAGAGAPPTNVAVTAMAAGAIFTYPVFALSDGTLFGRTFSGFTGFTAGLTGVTALAEGWSRVVALKGDGTVWDSGTNTPAGLSGVTAVSVGISDGYVLALKSDGTVVVWGEVGPPPWDYVTNVPVGLHGVTAIAAGGLHSLAVVPSIISSQPVGQSFTSGGGVTLSVSAIGTGLSYQWQFNGTNLVDATNSTLSLVSLSAGNAGTYRVMVTDDSGTVEFSQNANLTFFGNPTFYLGTTIAGAVGQKFRIDYADVMNISTTNWSMLTNITLPYSPFVVVDYSSPGQTKRFYRAVPIVP